MAQARAAGWDGAERFGGWLARKAFGGKGIEA
jgi:hypothetical protein